MLNASTTFSIVAVYYLVARTGVSGGQYERAFFVLLVGVTAARHVHLVLWSLPKQLRLRTIRPYAAFLVILVLEAVSVLLILAPIAADQPVSAIGIAELVSVRHVLFRPGEWLDVWRSGAVGTSALIVNGAFVAFQAGILGVLFRFREFAMTDEERVGRALRLLQFGVVDQAARILAGVRARTAESVMAEAALSLSKGAPEEAKHRVGLDFQIEDVPVTTNGTYLVLMGLCASLPLRCETCGIVFRDAMNKNVPDAYLALPFGTVLLRGCSENVLLGFGEQETGGLGKFLLYPLASMVAADVKEEAGLRALSWIFGASLPASALNKVAGSCLRANTRLRIESEKKDYDSLAATLKKWCEAELPDIRTWLTELSEDFDLVVASNYLVGVGAIAEAVDQNVFQQIDAVLKGILERVKSNKVAAGALQISRIAQYH